MESLNGRLRDELLNCDRAEFKARDLPAIGAKMAELGWAVVELPDLTMDLEG